MRTIQASARRHHVSNGHAGKVPNFSMTIAAFCGLLRFRGIANFGRPGRNIAEMSFSESKPLRKIDVSKNQQNGVVGNVVRAKKRLDITRLAASRSRSRRKNCERSPNCETRQVAYQAMKAAVGLIHYVDAHFSFTTSPGCEILVIDLERAHTVSFEPQNAFQGI